MPEKHLCFPGVCAPVCVCVCVCVCVLCLLCVQNTGDKRCLWMVVQVHVRRTGL